MMGDILFFRLDTKEKIPKERIKAVFFLLLSSFVPLKGLELASLRQSPLLDAPLRAFAWRRKNKAGRKSPDTTVVEGVFCDGRIAFSAEEIAFGDEGIAFGDEEIAFSAEEIAFGAEEIAFGAEEIAFSAEGILSVMEGLLSVLKRLLSVMERLFSVLKRLLSRRKVSRPHFLRVKRNVGKKRKKGRLSERSEFEPL